MSDYKKMDAKEKAQALRKAMKGLGTDDKTLIGVVASTDHAERMEIVKAYRELFKRSLLDDIKGDTSGNYRKLLMGLFQPRELVMANLIHKATVEQLIGTNDDMLISIITQFPERLPTVKELYKQRFDHELALDVSKDTTGCYRDLLLKRIDFVHVPVTDPVAEADRIYGNDHDSEYVEVFGGRTKEDLLLIEKAYNEKYTDLNLAQVVNFDTFTHFRQTLFALLVKRPTYFCCVLRNAVHLVGTKEYMINMVFTLIEKDELFLVAAAYYDQFKRSLYEDLKSDLSMNYRTLVLSMLDDAEARRRAKSGGN